MVGLIIKIVLLPIIFLVTLAIKLLGFAIKTVIKIVSWLAGKIVQAVRNKKRKHDMTKAFTSGTMTQAEIKSLLEKTLA